MQESLSLAESLALLPELDRVETIQSLTGEQAEELRWDWRFWARPKQVAPEGDWSVWILRAGRGFGKTRSGAGWVQERALASPGRWIALVSRTPADARDYMIEGPGGLLRNTAPHERPEYEPSKRRLTWPNGSWATIYSDGEPEQLRGFSGDTAWLDEFGKYRYPKQVWDNLQFGMREPSGDKPRRIITTTPRPLKILKEIERLPGAVTVVGSSYENRANLDESWFTETILAYEGTRFGRQEIHAEVLDDFPGALWTLRNLDEHRLPEAPSCERIVVSIDPAATSGEDANETGIVVVGLKTDADGHKHGFVLDDWSLKGSPDEWGRKAVAAYHMYNADRIIAERNNGGDMVESVIRSVSRDVPVRLVWASRGKYIRAEPVSALYEQGRVHHIGTHPRLEDQMVEFTPDIDRKHGSPDRVDALVWGFTELFPAITARRPEKGTRRPVRADSGYSPHRWRG